MLLLLPLHSPSPITHHLGTSPGYASHIEEFLVHPEIRVVVQEDRVALFIPLPMLFCLLTRRCFHFTVFRR
jgi:hypothetical protein